MSQRRRTPGPAQSPQDRHVPAVFWGLLALTAAVRPLGITRPLLGNFATKNCIYAMIARNWAEGRAGLFFPTLDILRGGSRSLHMLEFPVSAYLTGGLWKMLGGSLDVWGRATAVGFSVASVAVMYLFVRRRHGHSAATAAALVLALSPVSIVYGQSFMLEASLVFFTLAAFYTLDRWLAAGHLGWLVISGVCLALLLLTKIYMLVVLLPLAVMFCRWDRIRTWSAPCAFCGMLLLAILPAALWYAFAYRAASPAGPFADHIYYSLRESAEVHREAYGLLRSPDFYRQVLDNLTGVVLTPIGFVLLLAGMLDRRWRQYAAWLLAMILLVLALPRKFHEMNYYYMAVLPPLCIMAGLGWQVIQQRVRPGRAAVALLLLVAMLLCCRYAVRPALVRPEEDRGVLEAAREVQRLTADEEPVVTMHGTAIDLLYYCDRPGWVLESDDPQWETVLEDSRRRGARYVVIVGEGPILQSLVACGDNFRIHRLHE
jgi:4-amino-4-deoxy-L-arabinose transferase-like glycosyltransferase